MRTDVWAVAGAGLWLFAGTLIAADPAPAVTGEERACREQLAALAGAVRQFSLIHEGKRPARWSELVAEDFLESTRDLVEPGPNSRAQYRADVDAKADYSLAGLPGADGLLVREKAAHHRPGYVLAAFADGQVRWVALSAPAGPPTLPTPKPAGPVAKAPTPPVQPVIPPAPKPTGPVAKTTTPPAAPRDPETVVLIEDAPGAVPEPPAASAKSLSIFSIESAYLGKLGGYDHDPGANIAQAQPHLDWARRQSGAVVVGNLVGKYLSQFDRQAKTGEAAARQFYAESSARLAGYGIDLGSAEANHREVANHRKWADRQGLPEIRQTLERRIRELLNRADAPRK